MSTIIDPIVQIAFNHSFGEAYYLVEITKDVIRSTKDYGTQISFELQAPDETGNYSIVSTGTVFNGVTCMTFKVEDLNLNSRIGNEYYYDPQMYNFKKNLNRIFLTFIANYINPVGHVHN